MSTVAIRTIADVPVAAAAVIGYTPTESLVVMANGPGPTARVDLGAGAIQALAPAVQHWDQVLLIVYSTTPQAQAYLNEFTHAYPSVSVFDALDVQGDVVTSLGTGQTVPVAPIAPGILGDRFIADSRDALIAEAEQVNDPAEAVRLAEAYYVHGDGARAWVYADRARALGGDPSEIEEQMLNAQDPRGDR